jgi:hypothetical protein
MFYYTVLLIRDILVRIQIRRSIPLNYGSRSVDPYHWLTDPDPAFFRQWLPMARCQQKIFFFSSKFFLHISGTFSDSQWGKLHPGIFFVPTVLWIRKVLLAAFQTLRCDADLVPDPMGFGCGSVCGPVTRLFVSWSATLDIWYRNTLTLYRY